MTKEPDPLPRLRRMHATALGLYLAHRIMGESGDIQRRRMAWIEERIIKAQRKV